MDVIRIIYAYLCVKYYHIEGEIVKVSEGLIFSMHPTIDHLSTSDRSILSEKHYYNNLPVVP